MQRQGLYWELQTHKLHGRHLKLGNVSLAPGRLWQGDNHRDAGGVLDLAFTGHYWQGAICYFPLPLWSWLYSALISFVINAVNLYSSSK